MFAGGSRWGPDKGLGIEFLIGAKGHFPIEYESARNGGGDVVIRQISRLCRVLHRHQLPNPRFARSDTYSVLEGVCTGDAINDRQGCQPKERKPFHFEK